MGENHDLHLMLQQADRDLKEVKEKLKVKDTELGEVRNLSTSKVSSC